MGIEPFMEPSGREAPARRGRDTDGSGRVGFAFAPRNEFWVLDHEVTLPSGEVFYNPMRVVPDGEACEVVFTLRRQQGMTDEEFERDAAAVASDLETLKRLMESRSTAG